MNFADDNMWQPKEPPQCMEIPVKYYFIDFGLSTKFESFADRRPVQWVTGVHKNMPEMWETREDGERAPTRSYDPFSADIFVLGFVLATFDEVNFNR